MKLKSRILYVWNFSYKSVVKRDKIPVKTSEADLFLATKQLAENHLTQGIALKVKSFDIKAALESRFKRAKNQVKEESLVGKIPDSAFFELDDSIKFKNELVKKLSLLKDKNGKPDFDSFDIERILKVVDTPFRAKLAYDVSNIFNKNERMKIFPDQLKDILTSADTPKIAGIKLKFIQMIEKTFLQNKRLYPESQSIAKMACGVENREQIVFVEKLFKLIYEKGNSKLKLKDIVDFSLAAKNSHQMDLALYFIKKIEKTSSDRSFDGIAEVVKESKLKSQAKLARKLMEIKGKDSVELLSANSVKTIVKAASTEQKSKIMFDFALKILKDRKKLQALKLSSDCVADIVSTIKTSSQAKFKLKALEKISLIKSGNKALFEGADVAKFLDSIDSKNKMIYGVSLIKKLSILGKTEEKFRLNPKQILRIVASADDFEMLKSKLSLINNKKFMEKTASLDTGLAQKIFYQSLISSEKIDIDKMTGLWKFFKDNSRQLEHYNRQMTPESISNLFTQSMFDVTNFLDTGSIKYAIKLKYSKFKDFVENTSKLSEKLDKDTYLKLREKLTVLPSPDLKVELLQLVSGLALSSKNSLIKNLIDILPNPKVSTNQMDLAEEIFNSKKGLDEQIQEFFEKFDVSKENKGKFLQFFAPKSQQEQLDLIDKQIKELIKNPKKTREQKDSYLKDLKKKQKKILSNPEQMGRFNPSSSNMKILSRHIESYINIPEYKKVMNSYLNNLLYQNLGLKPDLRLTAKLHFDKQYFSKFFSAILDDDFATEFSKLINLLDKNPEKPLSELREGLAHNQITRKIFSEYGLNYDKWTKFDKNSFHKLTANQNASELKIRLTDDDDVSRNIFLGNHVGCCTAIDGEYPAVAVQHLMNTFVRGIEIVDASGNSFGNSMCYFAKVDDKLSFVIDSFEACRELINDGNIAEAIVTYAKKVSKEIVESNVDVDVVFGPRYSKFNVEKLKKTHNHKIEVLGKVDELTYIDAIGGAKDVNIPHYSKDLYELI